MHKVVELTKLIFYEYKKLFRSHLNKLMLILLLILPALGILMGLSNARVDPFCLSSQTLYVNGTTYCGVDILKQRNQANHQYAGNMGESWFAQVEQDIQNASSQSDSPNIGYNETLFPLVDKEVILNPNQYLLTKAAYDQSQIPHDMKESTNKQEIKTFLGSLPNSYSESYFAYLNTTFLNYNRVYEAQLGVSLFMNIMDMNWILMGVAMLLIGVILSGLFNQEYTSKSDQILKPTKIGYKQQAHAKLLCGASFTLCITLYILLVYLLYTATQVGFYDLSTTFIVVDEKVAPYLFTCWELILTSVSMVIIGMFACFALLMPLVIIAKTGFQSLLYLLALMIVLWLGGDVLSNLDIFTYAKNLSPLYFMTTPYLFTYSLSNVVQPLVHVSLGSTFLPVSYVYSFLWIVIGGILLWCTQRMYQRRSIENA